MEKEINVEELSAEQKLKLLSSLVDGALIECWPDSQMEFTLVISERDQKEQLVCGNMPLKKFLTVIIVIANNVLVSLLPDDDKEKLREFLNKITTAMKSKTQTHTVH